ncbi:hypothetical protein AB3S75_047411 [Citrus x aurantiifolia]
MAGLQYHFFPTDFFYPRRPPSVDNKDSTGTGSDSGLKPIIISAETLKRSNELIEGDRYNNKNFEKELSSQASISTALVQLTPCNTTRAHQDMTSTLLASTRIN